MLKSLFTYISCCIICLCFAFCISCKKQSAETNQDVTEINLGTAHGIVSHEHDIPKVTYPFSTESSGQFTISAVSATVVKIDQEMIFSSASPFPLIQGTVQGYDDLTIPTFPDRFFDGSFSFFGQGNDAVFAAVTVQTSVFSDPINPAIGDFFGSEDFTGTFQITGGTGRYLNAKGSGTYSAHSEWRPPIQAGTLFSGFTTVNCNGTISVLARNGQLQDRY
ncbi:MAG TPA: hypothetical protein VGQ09_00235 [Chitinophagaceae bacterium]|nr:hypothetical protein [Chitinophagaceae bacterium]